MKSTEQCVVVGERRNRVFLHCCVLLFCLFFSKLHLGKVSSASPWVM